MVYNQNRWGQGGGYEQVVAGAIDVSRFNGSQLINIRVQNYWASCGTAFKNGDFETLRDVLNVLWTEFYADAKKEHKEFIIGVDKKMSDAIVMQRKSGKDARKFSYFNNIYHKAIYDKWLFLKTLEKFQGSGKAYIDKDEDDWD